LRGSAASLPVRNPRFLPNCHTDGETLPIVI
jgi:hypothetical protein